MTAGCMLNQEPGVRNGNSGSGPLIGNGGKHK
jgi:hypothetical protein